MSVLVPIGFLQAGAESAPSVCGGAVSSMTANVMVMMRSTEPRQKARVETENRLLCPACKNSLAMN